MQKNTLDRRNDAADPAHRPVLTALVAKLEALPALEDRPEAWEWLIRQLLWRYERRFHRIQSLERIIRSAHLYASQTPVPNFDDFSESGDDASKSGSLDKGEEMPRKERNDTAPGPTHKSPVAYRDVSQIGFTIPEIQGKFVWQRVKPDDRIPDMDKVVEVVAAGLRLAEAPDLDDKKLRKRVRQIIHDHTLDWDSLICEGADCGQRFDITEDWAVHVRKLIWKELKK